MRKIFGGLLAGVSLAMVVVGILIALNYQTVMDLIQGMSYEPSAEMVAIREKLGLTRQGEIVFNASSPELNSEEEFNANCYKQTDSEETAVLGCYLGQKIYVYNVKSKDLNGILELTTAHELLHAVFERMSESEKDELAPLLEKVLAENQEILGEEVLRYVEDEQFEELYVRAGTEIKKLPAELEEHFAKIFNDQDKVVGFYDSYIKVFRELEARMRELKAEMEALNAEIEAKIKRYENGEYWLFNEINWLIDRYNADVEEYNNNVVRNNELKNTMNSRGKVN